MPANNSRKRSVRINVNVADGSPEIPTVQDQVAKLHCDLVEAKRELVDTKLELLNLYIRYDALQALLAE